MSGLPFLALISRKILCVSVIALNERLVLSAGIGTEVERLLRIRLAIRLDDYGLLYFHEAK